MAGMVFAVQGVENAEEVDPAVEEVAQRIIDSPQFARADTQRKLLQYLWLNRHRQLSEYAIATEALGRNHQFDPNTDASIRVQISRLRRKLKNYYAETGEPELLVIPTGSHQLVVQSIPSPDDIAPLQVEQDKRRWFRIHAVQILISACVLLAILLCAVTGLAIWQSRKLKETARLLPDQPNSFWRGFLDGDAPVKIVLPTPVFFNFRDHPKIRIRSIEVNAFDEAANDKEFMLLANKLGPMGLEQSYTVTWDTLAGIQIARYLDRIGQTKRVSFEVTRDSSLLSLEQANVIVLGTENTLRPMREYIDSMNFVMTQGEDRVINTHPEPKEEKAYLRVVQSSSKHDVSVRHIEPSIIALLPGHAPGLKVLMLESRDTSSMVSLLSSNAGSNAVEQMWRAHGSPKFFEMVTMTELEGNTPLRSWPVTLHAYTKASPAGRM